jgi:peptidoglycan/xylan/chitin deacetylase (PgdA/CDA1 family)
LPEELLPPVEKLIAGRRATVFFRADDIAIPSCRQDRLLQLFLRHQVPLCAAVVPTWITPARWQEICTLVGSHHHLFAWHQHGWNHRNHQQVGKKQEFGTGLTAAAKERTIAAGRARLTAILGDHFLPVFTPPWNRVDSDTLEVLRRQGYGAISRYRDDRLPSLPGLPDFPANVDLHTRKEASGALGRQGLLDELEQALSSGTVGLMIHHQRMNEAAFEILERLLVRFKAEPGLSLRHFGEMLAAAC